MELTTEMKAALLKAQKGEITEYHVYQNMARRIKDDHNREVVEEISKDEKKHYGIWKQYTGKDVKPNRFRAWLYTTISRVFGLTFGFKLMERREERAQAAYAEVFASLPESGQVMADEKKHEMKLLNMLDEEALVYAGSVVLGLNDALVELTGALAGLTLAFGDVKIIALSGLVTGIAASLSMAASEYISTSAEETEKNPGRAALYTGIAYVATVALLILPYLLMNSAGGALAVTLTISVAIIAIFNFYIAVAKDEKFAPRFLKMAGLSLGVAFLSFFIGYIIRNLLGVNI